MHLTFQGLIFGGNVQTLAFYASLPFPSCQELHPSRSGEEHVKLNILDFEILAQLVNTL